MEMTVARRGDDFGNGQSGRGFFACTLTDKTTPPHSTNRKPMMGDKETDRRAHTDFIIQIFSNMVFIIGTKK
jgi:hypothetical protein